MTETIPIDDDSYLWLEEVDGPDALTWARERTTETLDRFTGAARFQSLNSQIRQVLDSDDRIPPVTRIAGWFYNFWQDANNPRGVWRRTTLDEYRHDKPTWDVVLDIDELARTEDENWVWKGASLLPPDHRLALVRLSRGGSDAVEVREFDLTTRQFATAGFTLPEAKTLVEWIDQDHIYVATDCGPATLTASGYPRTVREWLRGTPLDQAPVVLEGKLEDVAAFGRHDHTPGFERDFLVRMIDMERTENFHRRPDGELVRIDVPEDAHIDVHGEWLVIRLRTLWQLGDTTYPAGTLLAARFENFMAGDRALTILFTPDAQTHLVGFSWTLHHLIVLTLSDVRSRLTVFTPTDGGWRSSPLPGVPDMTDTTVSDTAPDTDDTYLIVSSGFLEPATLRRGEIGAPDDAVEVLKQAPAFFDVEGLTVRQLKAVSDDGTEIPYFVVGRPDAPVAPTLLSAYGGFEASMIPAYSGSIGRAWLERGGTYVLANIRGGGEYGPQWHTQAVQANRHLVYEDFAAVARDLVARGITTPGQLGIEGGSNAGLIVGVMLTCHPELFGAVVCEMPLLDMYRYPDLLAGPSWISEYGDPRNPADWEFLRPYSPYHNVRAGQPYPPTLFVTSTRDDRVHPGHARKMVARLREYGYAVDYYENTEGGHALGSVNEQRAFHMALVFEFLWTQLQLDAV